jgi:demethylmenaquinone methyltransferase / 2-methoxy-6-polyprenyl-1,4-benzoquinol methylase
LVKQGGFERRFLVLKGRKEGLYSKVFGERLRAKMGEQRVLVEAGRRHQIDRAEAPGVIEGEHPARLRLQHQMVVLADLAWVEHHPPGHAEVENHAVLPVGVENRIFGPAVDAHHPRPGQPLAQIDREGPSQVGPAHVHPGEPLPDQHPRHAAGNSFNFGQLGHITALAKRSASPRTGAMTEQVSYGFQSVDPAEKTRRVRSVFERVARRYDIMNDFMSGGLHRLWKDHFVDLVRPRAGEAILDLAGGTGDIAFRMAKSGADIIVADINPDMLAVGEARAAKRGLTQLEWREENAESLSFADNSFDAVTIAFGIRNVTDMPKALRDIHRVLKRGGRFYCLEFSQMTWVGAADLYDQYSLKVVPKIGKVVARDEEAYQYLVESIRKFPDAPRFAQMIEEAGFGAVKFERMLGGVVAIHSGWKI